MFASGLNKEQVYESMKYYAPKVNSLGLTGAKNTEKILAIDGIAGQQGLEGATFGTGFNMMLSRMNKGPMRAATKGLKPQLQAIGDDLTEISLQLRLHYQLASVESRYQALVTAKEKQEPLALVLGFSHFKGHFVITELSSQRYSGCVE